jgi:hypothetical protein
MNLENINISYLIISSDRIDDIISNYIQWIII